MPKDNIQRAIDKAAGGDAENYEEIRYEGFGPGGVALIVEALTDNRNRTATNVRTAFTKNGGNLGASGSVSHGFDRMGLISTRRARATPTRCSRPRSRRAPRTSRATRTATRSGPRSTSCTRSPRRWRRRSARRRARSWPGGRRPRRGRRGRCGDAVQADRRAGGRRRRADRVGQLRSSRRGDGELG